ncbi:MAG: molybdenum cofactor guanylyltransferase [Verrucomicrobiota bacterium]
MNFSAVILAGGQSSRMGRDKARVEISGETLLARQIKLVRVAGAAEVLISGRADRDDTQFGLRVLTDNFPSSGPLAGIESALRVCRTPLLLVLAVDMPHMTAEFLQQLQRQCGGGSGILPRRAGQLEPLAAFYPRAAAQIATELLLQSKASPGITSPGVGFFASRCVSEALAHFYDLPADCAKYFTNWNEPQDVLGSSASDGF